MARFPRFLRRPQFRLRALVCLTTVACIALAGWGESERRYRARLAALDVLEAHGWELGVPNDVPALPPPWDYGRPYWRPVSSHTQAGLSCPIPSLRRSDSVIHGQIWALPNRGDGEEPRVSDGEVRAILRFPELRSLALGRRIDAKQLQNVTKGLRSLEKLQLFKGSGVTDDVISQLPRLPSLRILELTGAEVSGKGFEKLSRVSALRELRLNMSCADDYGIAHLRCAPSLRVLDLSNTEISDVGLMRLPVLPLLEELKLGKTRVTDKGISRLAAFTSLRSLDLNDTDVTGTGFEALKSLRVLEELNIYGTKVTAQGVKRLATLRSLRVLLLESLDISGASLAPISEIDTLESLTLDVAGMDDEALLPFSRLRKLRSLSLERTGISNDGLKALLPLQCLEEVRLRDSTAISDAGLMRLSRLKSLRFVDLHGAKSVTAAGVARLKKLRPDLGVSYTPAD